MVRRGDTAPTKVEPPGGRPKCYFVTLSLRKAEIRKRKMGEPKPCAHTEYWILNTDHCPWDGGTAWTGGVCGLGLWTMKWWSQECYGAALAVTARCYGGG